MFRISLYLFQVYSIVLRQLCALQSDSLQYFSTHRAPHIVMAISLTAFPVLCLTSL